MLDAIARKHGAQPVLIYVRATPGVIQQRRATNITTSERAHLDNSTMAKAAAMFEEPTIDENPIIYNAESNLDDWIRKTLLTAIKEAGYGRSDRGDDE